LYRSVSCIGPGSALKNQNAALRRRWHYLHFTAPCQQKPEFRGDLRRSGRNEKFSSALLQKRGEWQASWGKLENRFGGIQGTLVRESPALYVNKQLLERMRRT
jgi:hypothetical protein